METRYLVLALVVIVTLVVVARGVIGLLNGEVGTVARQFAVGLIIFAFGLALVKHWDELG